MPMILPTYYLRPTLPLSYIPVSRLGGLHQRLFTLSQRQTEKRAQKGNSPFALTSSRPFTTLSLAPLRSEFTPFVLIPGRSQDKQKNLETLRVSNTLKLTVQQVVVTRRVRPKEAGHYTTVRLKLRASHGSVCTYLVP